jgi:ABC-type branched-subunit amino acid transport system permease subunit
MISVIFLLLGGLGSFSWVLLGSEVKYWSNNSLSIQKVGFEWLFQHM